MTQYHKSRFDISPQKRAWLDNILRQEGLDTSTDQRIARRETLGTSSLSFAQERLWFLEKLEPESSVYNIPVSVRLSGPLGVEALRQSINEVVRRHETLRSNFRTIDGHPVQIIKSTLTLETPIIDLQNLTEQERDAKALALAHDEAQRIFDLERGPLLRSTLLRHDVEDHTWLLTMHHIISDADSFAIFFHEVSNCYAAQLTNIAPQLQQLPIHYGDFAIWQREQSQGEAFQ